jgi:hypothetical protein
MEKSTKCIVRGCNSSATKHKCLCLGCFYYLTKGDDENEPFAHNSQARQNTLEEMADLIAHRVRCFLFNIEP